MVKSHALLLCLTLDINNLGSVYPTSWLSDRRLGITVLMLMLPLFYLIMTPACKHIDSGNLNITQTSDKVFPLCENVTVLKL